MKYLFGVLFFVVLTQNIQAQSKTSVDFGPDGEHKPCDKKLEIASEQVNELSRDVLRATNELYTSLAKLKVKHDGDGDIGVLTTETGDLAAIRFNYQSKDAKENKQPGIMLNVTMDEINNGKVLEFPGKQKDQKPLRLYGKRPPGFNPATGGIFVLEIVTDFDPLKTTTYDLVLKKDGGKWVGEYTNPKKKLVNVKNVTLYPTVSWLKWAGTFNEAGFE